MAIPSKGPISLNDIRQNLGVYGPISLNDYRVRALAKKPSGTISLKDCYKQSAENVYKLVVERNGEGDYGYDLGRFGSITPQKLNGKTIASFFIYDSYIALKTEDTKPYFKEVTLGYEDRVITLQQAYYTKYRYGGYDDYIIEKIQRSAGKGIEIRLTAKE
ncbi:hypothetical protein [Fusobacterium necrophorum]|uniref:hypothetical protein n=1 Tax=Fusobacterium necrophorum TaxID=859 RepID=UPI000787CA91|nr:hypothetical protein [Fusobacterium necrophorum]AYV95943.1 hypothetical protein BWX37_10055 [Fusobacterium necrophorum subsp. funduliforme]KYL03897.1 hypothetical protein A2J06_07790 [Fusobacterium necrophorum subsp. funduliforme]